MIGFIIFFSVVAAAFFAGWRARGTWDANRDAYDRQWPEATDGE